MKKIMIVLMTIVLCFGLSACGSKKQNDNNPSTQTNTQVTQQNTANESQNQIPNGAITAIGKTFNQLKKEYPDYVAEDANAASFLEADFPYLGLPDAQYSFVFFGTQEGDILADLGKYYGNQIKCIGATGTVGNIFPEMTTDLSFKDFFSFLGVKKYTFNDWKATDRPAPGALIFKYEGYDIVIDADDSQSKKIVKQSYPILITKGDKTINDHYYNKVFNKLYPN